jgi:hypothetical protein
MAISNNSTGLRPGVCTSTTRPTAPYEGQMIYETDTDMVAIWNGTAWRYISATTPTNGTVLQVVTNASTTMATNDTATFADCGLSATITPKSTSSKILVYISHGVFTGTATVQEVRLLRDATTVNTFGHALLNDNAVTIGYANFISFDSPSTTSATTYKTQFRRVTGAGTSRFNYVDANGTQRSTITLMEIAG